MKEGGAAVSEDGTCGPAAEGAEPQQLQVTLAGRTRELQLIAVGESLEDAEGLLFELAGDLDLRNRRQLTPAPYGKQAWTVATETGPGLLVEVEDGFLVYYAADDPADDA